MPPIIARIALPVPLDKQFDYLVSEYDKPVIGGRVRVPFRRQKLIGIVTQFVSHSECPTDQLKSIIDVIDDEPVWPDALFRLLTWTSDYYHHPVGDTFSIAMPAALRKGKPACFTPIKEWHITDAGREQFMHGMRHAVKQAKVLHMLLSGPVVHEQFSEHDVSTTVLNNLEKKKWIQAQEKVVLASEWECASENVQLKPFLNEEQSVAIATVNSQVGFGCFLLDGVTGSGKTEVYLNLIAPVLARKQQVLVLVPEIGLTPQTIERFCQRFNVPVDVMHSGLNDTERFHAWLAARDGRAGIVIGTRSALFTPFRDLGMIIVDEEHDSSYKQQDSLRYHARDLAVMRANLEQIPVILGSATPSLESFYNALSGKYYHLTLTQRAGHAVPTTNRVLDIKGLYLTGGLSGPLIADMRRHLAEGNQVLLFLNRRGYAPALMCHECGWIAECSRCDRYYTYHQGSHELRCHHCGAIKPVIHRCKQCGSSQMHAVGVGTEQLEEHLGELFPEYKTIRIDRDSTRRKGSLDVALEGIRNGDYQILIGTQMLAKGHHFPNVTLVSLLDVDSALYSNDFRASERLAQLFMQVAGRAGRASKPGEVVLQTHHPEHPLVHQLLANDYPRFIQAVLDERRLAALPPYSFLTLFRAESQQSPLSEDFLHQVRQTFEVHPLFDGQCSILGPTPAPITKRAGKFRWQLVLQVSTRSQMQRLLADTQTVIGLLPLAKKVKWTIDVEPQDFS